MNDDAVAPVIAVMLILAVLATFFAIWQTVALPSMKAESEIGHLHSVEQSFVRFSTDLANAASLRQEISLSEPISLGGGDTTFDSLRSSGTIGVYQEPQWVFRVNTSDGTNERMSEGRMVNFSYRPEGNFWQEQGYSCITGTSMSQRVYPRSGR